MSENTLLALRARAGDMEAFGQLYQLVYRDLYRYALYALRNAEEAEDAVADCVSEALKGIKGLRDEALFRSWIFAILYRTVKRQFRQRGASPLALETLPDIADASGPFEDSLAEGMRVLGEIGKLSEEERQIVLLSAVGGYSGKEIAKIARLPHGTVRSKLSRALAKLRDALTEDAKGKK
jgi:RNA polymerase sigma-70 factor (ECF subfamily)